MPVEDQIEGSAAEPASDASPPRGLPPARTRVRLPPASAKPAAELRAPPTAVSDYEDVAEAPAKPGYEVGYGKPPKHSQFKPGNNANPKGRPRGAKSFWTDVEEEMAAIVLARLGGRQVKLSGQRVAAKAYAAKLMKGDPKAIDQWVKHQQQKSGNTEASARSEAPLTDKENAQIEAIIALLNGQAPHDGGAES